jgi:outer membrane protein TolC
MLEQSIQLEVTNARTEYLTALERSQSQEKNVALAQKIYDTTQIKYRSGVGSSIEVTQAEQALYETQQNFIQARYQLLVAKQNLDTVLGK